MRKEGLIQQGIVRTMEPVKQRDIEEGVVHVATWGMFTYLQSRAMHPTRKPSEYQQSATTLCK